MPNKARIRLAKSDRYIIIIITVISIIFIVYIIIVVVVIIIFVIATTTITSTTISTITTTITTTNRISFLLIMGHYIATKHQVMAWNIAEDPVSGRGRTVTLHFTRRTLKPTGYGTVSVNLQS